MKGAVEVDREQRGRKKIKKIKKSKRRRRLRRVSKRDFFDFSPANKKEHYILPTPLENQAASRSEELIREDGRFSTVISSEKQVPGSSLGRQTRLELQ